MSELILQSIASMNNLRERLESCPMISKLASDEASTLVYAFSDLEKSLRLFLDEQLPKLADQELKGEELEDLMLDIREEFRHVLYHLHDPLFFRAMEPTHEWLVLAEPPKK